MDTVLSYHYRWLVHSIAFLGPQEMLEGRNCAVLVGGNTELCAIEISETIRAMKGVGARVHLVSSSTKTVRIGEDTVRIDLDIVEARAEDFDAVIICGDYTNTDATVHLPYIKFLQDALYKDKLIAAIGKGLALIKMADLTEGEDVKSLIIDAPRKRPEVHSNKHAIGELNLILAYKTVSLMDFVDKIIVALRERYTQV